MSTRSCIPYGFISLHSKSVLHLLVDRLTLFNESWFVFRRMRNHSLHSQNELGNPVFDMNGKMIFMGVPFSRLERVMQKTRHSSLVSDYCAFVRRSF
jgi:hypothetical protein